MTDHPLVPHDPDTTVHLVMNDYGDIGCTYGETDLRHCDRNHAISSGRLSRMTLPDFVGS